MGSPVLLVKTHAFGDALLCTPAASALAARERLWVLTGPSAAEVWARMPGVERLFVAPFPFSGVAGLLRLLRWSGSRRRELRDVGLTVVLQSSGAVRRWVRWLTGAPMRSAGESPLGGWESVSPLRRGVFAGDSYSTVAGVDAGATAVAPVFPVTDEEREWAGSLLDGSRYVAVAPGGGRNPRDDVAEKRWPAERFGAVCKALVDAGLRIVLLGGPGDRLESEELLTIAPVALDLAGRTTWGQAAAVLEGCAAFLGNDSGLAHLATAVGAPAVVVFGPTSPSELYAPGSVKPVSADISCSPCYASSVFGGCRRDRPVCMEAVRPEDAAAALWKVIDEGNGS